MLSLLEKIDKPFDRLIKLGSNSVPIFLLNADSMMCQNNISYPE